jgi:glutamate-1-semialdehyde 2,1-aminomutase
MQALSFENAGPKKMKHPGTFNGNPLSAAAGTAALDVVATGEPCRTANLRAKQLRAGLNGVFADQNVPWVAYGDFSTVKIHPDYTGPRPADDDFIPFGNDYLQLDRKFDPALSHSFRCALLLSGIDWMGWGGNVSAAHREIDIEQTVSGFAQAIERLKADGYVRAIG